MQAPVLSARDIHRTYDEGDAAVHALVDVSLDIAAGASTAIVGRSGSGKSTLMHLLALLDRPSRGSVLVNGQDTHALDAAARAALRAEQFGFVFQQFFLMPHLTVLENVVLPLTIAGVGRRERTRRALEQLEILDLAHRARAKGTELSGGERQRAAIARALVAEPAVLFADEPTGNLDTANGEVVEQILLSLVKERGVSLVLVTHDPGLASRCDRQITIADGRVVDDSATMSLSADSRDLMEVAA